MNDESDEIEVHIVWAILGISIMFIPGILSIFMFLGYGGSRGLIKNWLIVVSMAFFPLTVVLFQFCGVLTCQGEIFRGYMVIGVALEAFVESFLQMILQVYTIMYGYESTDTQKATIAASFIILSKASIDLDTEMYEHDIGAFAKVLHYLKLIPGYTSTIAFRVLAFAITLAFLRFWAILPMALLLIKLIVISCISFRKYEGSAWFQKSAFLPLIITNLGVPNVGMIGAMEFMKCEQKQGQGTVAKYAGATNTFIKLSSVFSFLHHVTVLSVILGLVVNNPNYFKHWEDPKFIIKNYDGYIFIHIYWIFTVIIGLGIFGIQSSLTLGARGLKMAK